MFLDVVFVTVKICSILIMTSAMAYFFYSWITKAKASDVIFGFALSILVTNVAFPNLLDLHVVIMSGIVTVVVCLMACVRLCIVKAKEEHSRN